MCIVFTVVYIGIYGSERVVCVLQYVYVRTCACTLFISSAHSICMFMHTLYASCAEVCCNSRSSMVVSLQIAGVVVSCFVAIYKSTENKYQVV